MKKIMMMALMAAAATTAFAQDALVKEAKKQLGNKEYAQAVKTLTPALTSAETKDKAAAWNLLVDIHYQQFSDIQTQELENKVKKITAPYDTLAMHHSAVAALEAAIKCDEVDRQPDAKGKVKIKFRQPNQQRLQNVRLALINAGLYEYNHKNLDAAFKDWSLYLESSKDPFFEGVDLSKDQYRSEIAYYAALVAYQKKDYANAEKYAHMAAEDPAKANEANEILLFSKKENCKTAADSLEYVNKVKELHKANPSEERYFNLLMEYYTRANDMKGMAEWVAEEEAIDPNNKMVWALKGEIQMNDRKWDEAVASYKKALEIDPDFVQCIFNAGVCLNSKAIDLKDQLADKRTGGLTAANAKKVKDVLTEAQSFVEKTKELDPDQEKVKWAYALYQIYYSLKDPRAAEMEKLINK
jgi:tetratricopeptide (TPR) repeat protein